MHGDRAGADRVPADLVSSGHLISSRPARLDTTRSSTSLAFSVMLHSARSWRCWSTSGRDWLRLVPAGLRRDPRPLVRGRSGPAARAGCSWSRPIPAAIAGRAAQRRHRDATFRAAGLGRGDARRRRPRSCGSPTAGARRTRDIDELTFPVAIGIGVAQALALIPGISRSGISISAGLFAGLDREAAARFAFLMATPITAGAGALRGPQARRAARPASTCRSRRCVVGMVAALVSGLLAIAVPAALPADALARRLRRVPPRRWRRSSLVVWLRLRPGDPMEVMKQLRQRAIRDLVEQRPIRTQQELAAALRERGFRTTQATISRDVAELGLIKVTREGTAAYALPPRLDRGGDLRRGPPAQAARRPAGRDPRGRPAARHPDAARVGARRSPPRSTGRAGPRSPARSPATTRSSSRFRTAARCSGSSDRAASAWRTGRPDARGGAARPL